MYKASDFRIITYKNDDDLRKLESSPPNSVSYPYAFPYTYFFVSKSDKYIVKVGRSRQPHYRLREFNQHTRKYLNGVEFKASIIIDSPVYFENYLKKLLSGARYEVDSRVDGSTEVYDLRRYKWKTPLTTAKRAIMEYCLHQSHR